MKDQVFPLGKRTILPDKLQYVDTAIRAKENEYTGNGYTKVVQAKKSIWRMPWHWEPMKDVTSCDKLR